MKDARRAGRGASRGATCFRHSGTVTSRARYRAHPVSLMAEPLRERPALAGAGVDFPALPPALHRPAGLW